METHDRMPEAMAAAGEALQTSNPISRPSEALRSYQWEGVNFLLSRDAALLADEMGLGKTVQAAVALSIASRTLRRILLIVPAPLRHNWEQELARWALAAGPGVTSPRQ